MVARDLPGGDRSALGLEFEVVEHLWHGEAVVLRSLPRLLVFQIAGRPIAFAFLQRLPFGPAALFAIGWWHFQSGHRLYSVVHHAPAVDVVELVFMELLAPLRIGLRLDAGRLHRAPLPPIL